MNELQGAKKMNDETCVLTVQLGNSETKCGVFKAGELQATWATATHVLATPDDITLNLQRFLETQELVAPAHSIKSSLVTAATDAWVRALSVVCGTRPLLVGPGLKTGLSHGYKDPAQIGADIVVCAVAAKQLWGEAVIVADFGQTTTLSVLDANGVFAGGVIAPGLPVCMDALASSAAQLIPLTLRPSKRILGRSTAEAVQSGVVMGEVLRADGFIDALWDELGQSTRLVATGRYASLVAELSCHEFRIEPHLALQGLHAVWSLNKK